MVEQNKYVNSFGADVDKST